MRTIAHYENAEIVLVCTIAFLIILGITVIATQYKKL